VDRPNHLHLSVRTKLHPLGEIRMGIKITAKPNGPYLVTGDLNQLEITDINGNKYDISGKQTVALCRCGGSVKKPFCDGTHSKIGFQAAEAAVKLEG
jgi:3-phenylpropionate/trans-cinnamate dioxygenase ferredoxin subunit